MTRKGWAWIGLAVAGISGALWWNLYGSWSRDPRLLGCWRALNGHMKDDVVCFTQGDEVTYRRGDETMDPDLSWQTRDNVLRVLRPTKDGWFGPAWSESDYSVEPDGRSFEVNPWIFYSTTRFARVGR